MRSIYLMLGVLLVSNVVQAEPLTEVKWHVDEQLYRCSLTADLDYVNLKLEIHSEPEMPLTLSVLSDGFERFGEKTNLVVNRPYWSRQAEKQYYELDVSGVSGNEVVVTERVAEILEDLKSGNWVGLVDNDLSIEFPSLSLEELSGQFTQCRTAMPLVTFQTARDNEFLFENGKPEFAMNSGNGELLDAIASVIVKDRDVVKVLVDGHTDSTGDEVDNLQLSSKRASFVAMELVNRGAPIEKIETRSHGRRYPKVSNATKDGRNQNRRVQVRLIRKVQ